MLQDFVDQVERHIAQASSKGSRIEAIYVCPAGEQGIMEENVKKACGAVDVMPQLRIHGVPVKVAKRMRSGRFFYLLKEEK